MRIADVTINIMAHAILIVINEHQRRIHRKMIEGRRLKQIEQKEKENV